MRITVDIELQQVGPSPVSERAATIAVARALMGKLAGGRTVWARQSATHETAYRVVLVRGSGFEVLAPDGTGEPPVRELRKVAPDASA